MKTKEELNALKDEVENLNRKLRELTEDELAQVIGGQQYDINNYENEVEREKYRAKVVE